MASCTTPSSGFAGLFYIRHSENCGTADPDLSVPLDASHTLLLGPFHRGQN